LERIALRRWLRLAFSTAALRLRTGNKNRLGFVTFMVANLSWIAVACLLGNLAIGLGNLAFFVYNLRGFKEWGRPAGSQSKSAPPRPFLAGREKHPRLQEQSRLV
jgi:hypothetical protein